MKTQFPERDTFDLPMLKLEAALEVAAKALDFPAHRLNTPSRKPEAQLPVDALCLLHAKAQASIKMREALVKADATLLRSMQEHGCDPCHITEAREAIAAALR